VRGKKKEYRGEEKGRGKGVALRHSTLKVLKVT
jgi:hypothetical protein